MPAGARADRVPVRATPADAERRGLLSVPRSAGSGGATQSGTQPNVPWSGLVGHDGLQRPRGSAGGSRHCQVPWRSGIDSASPHAEVRDDLVGGAPTAGRVAGEPGDHRVGRGTSSGTAPPSSIALRARAELDVDHLVERELATPARPDRAWARGAQRRAAWSAHATAPVRNSWNAAPVQDFRARRRRAPARNAAGSAGERRPLARRPTASPRPLGASRGTAGASPAEESSLSGSWSTPATYSRPAAPSGCRRARPVRRDTTGWLEVRHEGDGARRRRRSPGETITGDNDLARLDAVVQRSLAGRCRSRRSPGRVASTQDFDADQHVLRGAIRFSDRRAVLPAAALRRRARSRRSRRAAGSRTSRACASTGPPPPAYRARIRRGRLTSRCRSAGVDVLVQVDRWR